MKDRPLLSICIPTYNRGKYLDEAIASIITQVTNDIKNKVEICISDNASTDNTDEIVRKWQKKTPIPIVYNKNPENLGADRNFLKVVEIANGEYCWFLGSDDALEKGALKSIVKVLENTEFDFYLLTQNCYDKELKNRFSCKHHPLLDLKENKVLCLEDILTGAIYLLGYLSVLVIKRDIFLKKIPLEEKYIGSMYVHTYKILYWLNNGSKIFFIRKPAVKWRSDNDSFLEELKVYGRIKIDIWGYYNIAKDIFGENSKEFEKIVKIRILDKAVGFLLAFKFANISKKEILEPFKCVRSYRVHYLKIYLLASVPLSVYKILRSFYRNTLKKFWRINFK